MTAVFIGHANYVGQYNDILKHQTEELIKKGVCDFLCGGSGGFERAGAHCVRMLEKLYPHIKLYLVVAYMNFCERTAQDYDGVIVPAGIETCHYKAAIPFRNRYMIDQSDFAICYINRTYGGAYQSYRYAEKKTKIIRIEKN